jgi:hypothetical protein
MIPSFGWNQCSFQKWTAYHSNQFTSQTTSIDPRLATELDPQSFPESVTTFVNSEMNKVVNGI